MGMVKEPVVTTFAAALPLTEPNSALDITETFAGPPACRPVSAIAMSWIRVPSPLFSKNAPNITNRTI